MTSAFSFRFFILTCNDLEEDDLEENDLEEDISTLNEISSHLHPVSAVFFENANGLDEQMLKICKKKKFILRSYFSL